MRCFEMSFGIWFDSEKKTTHCSVGSTFFSFLGGIEFFRKNATFKQTVFISKPLL